MTDNLADLETAVEGMLAKEPMPSPERIRELVDAHRVIPMYEVDDEAAEHLARLLEARHGVSMTIGSVLKQPDWVPWLESAKAEIDPYYWSRYKRLLVQRHFSGHVVAALDDVTDRILGLLEHPAREGFWDRRGMVMGHVQSGKTANYTGLICKAADAGYKVIIVIAGIHNNLRNQTQLRIDEGFVGRDSARLLSRKSDVFIGAGKFDGSRRPITFTNSLRDFNKNIATGVGVPLQNLSEPAVFVIKKNSSTLKYLLEWLREHSARFGTETIDAPMLLIDDEADNASINIKHGKDEVSRINGQIRGLLHMFERSCYVGYTATPFANIFIDPSTDDDMLGDDLFPRSFIVSLDPPTNYFGPSKVFLDGSDAVIRHIDDNEDLLPLKHGIDLEVVALPPSLVYALRTFVLGRAIRLARGHDRQHSSMLVNASRFTNVQRQLRNEIHRLLERIQSSARVNGSLPDEEALRDPELAALREVWLSEYSDTEFNWSIVQSRLNEAAAPIAVIEVNSRSAGKLDYAAYEDTGRSVVAVGGFSLSRGLTLEGLMVSYFLRNSMMYDTLMQMGRWFGYRPEYEDLCRVWMPEEAEGWYAHIAESTEMLREELRTMERAGATPQDFGLKVRSHPDTLIVTARNKMGSGEKVVVSIGLANSFVETATLKRDEASLEANLAAARRLGQRLSASGHPLTGAVKVSGGWLLKGAPVQPILDFVGEFRNHPLSMLTEPGPVRKYIEERREGELSKWDVLFASIGHDQDDTIRDTSLGVAIDCQRRTAGRRSDSRTIRVTNKQRVASRGIEKTGLSGEDVALAEATYVKNHPDRDPARAKNFPDWIYREKRTQPLLILHLLKVLPQEGEKELGQPVAAWSISFPSTGLLEERVEYVVNTTWMKENFPDEADELDEDDMEGDLE